MKTAIVYTSVHHGNTKKIIDEIAKTKDVEQYDEWMSEHDVSFYSVKEEGKVIYNKSHIVETHLYMAFRYSRSKLYLQYNCSTNQFPDRIIFQKRHLSL